jgi:hypothetical protein
MSVLAVQLLQLAHVQAVQLLTCLLVQTLSLLLLLQFHLLLQRIVEQLHQHGQSHQQVSLQAQLSSTVSIVLECHVLQTQAVQHTLLLLLLQLELMLLLVQLLVNNRYSILQKSTPIGVVFCFCFHSRMVYYTHVHTWPHPYFCVWHYYRKLSQCRHL